MWARRVRRAGFAFALAVGIPTGAAGAVVHASAEGTAAFAMSAASAVSDGDRYHAPRWYPGVEDSTQAAIVLLDSGETSPMLTIPLPSGGGKVSGRVLGAGPNGAPEPIAGVLVELTSGDTRLHTLSGPDGAFVFQSAPPGAARLRYSTDHPYSRAIAHEALWHPGVTDSAAAEVVIVQEGAQTQLGTVVLPEAAVLEGTVRAADSGAPFAGSTVRIERLDDGRSWEALVRPTGAFWRGGLPGGTYRIQARVEETGYVATWFGGDHDPASAEAVVVAAPGARRDLAIDPPRGGTMWGEVREENFRPIAGTAVEATNLSTGAVHTGVTNEFGVFSIRGLPSGRYRVFVPLIFRYYPSTHVPAEARPVTVAAPDEVFGVTIIGPLPVSCSIPAPSQGFVVGHIVLEWTGVERAEVVVFSETDTVRTPIPIDGSYSVPCLGGGTYRAAFLVDGPRSPQYYDDTLVYSEAELLTIVPGDSVDGVDFDPPESVVLEGDVVDAFGAGLPGVPILARERTTGTAALGTTDAAGRFRIDRAPSRIDRSFRAGLPAGEWVVRAGPLAVGDPEVTPVVEPVLEAFPDGGGVRLSAWIPPGDWLCSVERESADGRRLIVEEAVASGPRGARLEWSDAAPPAGAALYRLRLRSEGGATLEAQSGPIEAMPRTAPRDARLRIHPVPWSGSGDLVFGAPDPVGAGTRLRVFDASGRQIAALPWAPGTREKRWAPSASGSAFLPSGAYFCRLETERPAAPPAGSGVPGQGTRSLIGEGMFVVLR